MSKKTRNTICITLSALFIILSGVIPASAASTAVYTSNYYVYGEKTYGKLKLEYTGSTATVTASTYCEKIGAGKKVYLYFKYKDINGNYQVMKKGSVSDSTDYVYDKTVLAVVCGTTGFSKLVKAFSKHKVVVVDNSNSRHYWDSEECEDRPVLPVT